MDVLTKSQRRKNMRAIKSKNTKIEIRLGKAMWSNGIRYRKHVVSICGKPDYVIKKYKLTIFVDSEFWHGKNWMVEKYRIKSNRAFWWKKIESNIRRDKIVNKTLKNQGYNILRFWGSQVDKNLEVCIFKILAKIESISNGKILSHKEKT